MWEVTELGGRLGVCSLRFGLFVIRSKDFFFLPR